MALSREDYEHIVRRAKQNDAIDVKQLENILWPITEGNLGNKAILTVERVKGMIQEKINIYAENIEILKKQGFQTRLEDDKHLLEYLLKKISEAENGISNN